MGEPDPMQEYANALHRIAELEQQLEEAWDSKADVMIERDELRADNKRLLERNAIIAKERDAYCDSNKQLREERDTWKHHYEEIAELG